MSANTLEWDSKFPEDSTDSDIRSEGYAVHEAADILSSVMEADVVKVALEEDSETAIDTINSYIGFLGKFDLHITQPAYTGIDQHSVEDFGEDVNADNFLLFLLGEVNPDNINPDSICEQRRKRPCYQRVAFLLPETTTSLRETLHDHVDGFHALSWEHQEQVVTVYQIMRLLVDENDPHVTDKNGYVDPYYLKR